MDIAPITHDAADALTDYLAQLGSGVLERVQNSAIDRLYTLAEDQLRATQAGAAILERVEESPQDASIQAYLRSALQVQGEANQQFADQLAALVREVQASKPSRGDYRASFNNSGDFQIRKGATFAQGDVDQSKKVYRSGSWKFWVGGASALLLLSGGITAIVSAATHADQRPNSAKDHTAATGEPSNGDETASVNGSPGGELREFSRKLTDVFFTSGPVICNRTNEGWVASRYNIGFKEKAASVSFGDLKTRLTEIAKQAGGGTSNIPNPCEHGVSAISPDGNRIAIQVDTNGHDYTDGGGHVGWLDLTTGRFFDITQKSAKSGYSPEEYIDSNPGFSGSGDLWFLRDSQEIKSADKRGRLASRKFSFACFKDDLDEGYQVVGSLAIPCLDPIHPNKRFVAEGNESSGKFAYDVISPGADRFSDLGVIGPWDREVRVKDAKGTAEYCNPTAWLSSTELLCTGDDNEFFTVTVNPSRAESNLEYLQTDTLAVKSVIAASTNRRIFGAMLTPDYSWLYILAGGDGQGDTGKVYRGSLKNPGKVEEVSPLPAGTDLYTTIRWNT
ncbi:hypothetical protein [Streptomyces sp. CS113]|uniref:hypothetical protein n=1 Tax=Streptomyces sp. CS113 TaxID=1982761 RepID=UPI00117F21B0|nr:hypothetical protein [Streptomyces sp. CS113]